MVFQETLNVNTKKHHEMQDLTSKIAHVVERSGIQTGTVHIFNLGSTASIGTIEFEPGLKQDLPDILEKLMPPGRHYGHEMTWHDGNAHSHLHATVLGPSLTVPISHGHLALGTWQQIFHLECDIKARQRRVIVTVIGE